ncbi:MAG: glycosyltransferase family 39 protein [Planctomycetota bacterium]
MRGHGTLLTALGAFAVLLSLCVWFNRSYGVTWDFTQSAFYGERYLRYFATFDPRYLDFKQRAITFPPSHPDLEPDVTGNAPGTSGPHFIWPLPFTLGAAGCFLFHLTWPLLDFHAAHHVADFVLAAVLLVTLILAAGRRLGQLAATCAAFVLLVHPQFFGNLFNNLRDIPVACFFGLALLALPGYVEQGRRRHLVWFTLLLGAALACKTTAVFVPVVALPYVFVAARPGERAGKLLMVLLCSALALVVCFALWPWLWADPWFRLRQHLEFIRQERNLVNVVHLEPLLEALFTMPPILLPLAAIGIVVLSRARTRRAWLVLLLVWLLVPLVRICLPRARNYGGIRHFIEFLPAFALFCGVGVAAVYEVVRAHARPLRLASFALLVPAVWPAAAAHPFQTSYCNFLCGGVAGARRLGLTAAYDFWGSSMRPGIEWLTRNAPADSSVIVPLGDQIVSVVKGIWLRSDLDVITAPSKLGDRAGHVYAMVLIRAAGDAQDRLPWLSQSLLGGSVFSCALDGQLLLDLRDLGTHAEARPRLEQLYARHCAELAARLPALEARVLAAPDEIERLLDYFLALRELFGEQQAARKFLELLPRIDDPVLREKVQRLLHELDPHR